MCVITHAVRSVAGSDRIQVTNRVRFLFVEKIEPDIVEVRLR